MSSAAPMQQAKTNVRPTTEQRASQLATQHQQSSADAVHSDFTDLRAQTTAQLQVQNVADNSPQSRQLHSFQQMAQNSARSMQLKAMSAMMNAPAVQRVEEEETLQPKTKGETVQREATTNATEAPKPNNTGLPDHLKSGIESLSGMSMDHVKVHYNSSQPAQLNAHAYAQGSEIHVAPGQEQHLPHEAWHVVQQAQGRVQPTMQMKGNVAVNDDAGLEHEADVMGAKAFQYQKNGVQLTDRPASAILQRRVIKMLGDDEEVNRSAEILAADDGQQVVSWPFEGELKSPEVETFIAHSAGATLNEQTPEDFALGLIPKTLPRTFYSIRIAGCKTGKTLENGSSFASSLQNSLKSKGRVVSVTAPKKGLYIGGPRMYIQSDEVPFNQPAFRDVSRPALAQLEIDRVNRLVEACKSCIPNIAADDVKKVEVATKLNSIAQRRTNKTPINGSQQKNIEKIRETLEFCKNTTKLGRPFVDAVLAEIITIAGGAHDDADWVKAQEKAIYKQAFEALMLVDERFKIDDTFGTNQEAWTTEAYLPIASI